ncbi:MAG: cytochrome c-type biogenesis protein [Gammaproteobacteria bacterium]
MKKLLICLVLLVTPVFAAQDFYQFDTQEQQIRFEALTTQFRCLVCQNQNIAESNATLANDLREQIYQKIRQGESDNNIVNYLVARYGDYVLYRPPVNTLTLGLWFGPSLLLLLGLGYLMYYVRKKS